MSKKIMSLILVFAALILIAPACGPLPAAQIPTATNQLHTVAPTETTAPTNTLAPTATTAPSETPLPTATATLKPTATPLPTYTPIPQPVGYSYSDDFSDTNSGWPMDVNDDSTYGYVKGSYAIVINAESYMEPIVPENYLGTGDVVIEVDAWKDAGSDAGDFGVLCGFQDYQNYFIMGMSTDGSIGVYQMKDDEESTLLYQERRFTPADKYHLIANCQNGHFTLDVNGKIAINLEDPLLTSDGGVGIYGGSFEKGPFIYYFDNFKAEQAGEIGEQVNNPVAETIKADGEIVFSDDFSTKTGDWTVFSGENSGADYDNNAYKISIKTPMYAQWNLPGGFDGIGDTVIEVDARLASGPDKGDFGIICGYKDNDNFHVLAIANDGYAEIMRWVNGDDDIFASTIDAFTPAEEYHLIASCVGGNLSLSVNGIEVLTASSENLENDGGVGLYGGTFDEGNAVYTFDNFIVHKP
ncbi:MAG TPA: hypothetical protein VLR89_00390 [Anaerolineaceae bacterium]|nr:hypothetical protein [Anaerolineaceae bacterium]